MGVHACLSASDILEKAARCSSLIEANAARWAALIPSYASRSSGLSLASSAAGRPGVELAIAAALIALLRSSGLMLSSCARCSALIEEKAARSSSDIPSYMARCEGVNAAT